MCVNLRISKQTFCNRNILSISFNFALTFLSGTVWMIPLTRLIHEYPTLHPEPTNTGFEGDWLLCETYSPFYLHYGRGNFKSSWNCLARMVLYNCVTFWRFYIGMFVFFLLTMTFFHTNLLKIGMAIDVRFILFS